MSEHHASGFPKFLSFVVNRLIETTVWTFAELGIADLLATADTPQTADELAQKQGWNSEYLYRVLRCAANANIVHEIKYDQTNEPEKTNRFELTEDGRFLTSNHPSKSRYLLCWELSPFTKTSSHHLPEMVREGPSKGTGVQRVTGNEAMFDFLKKEENRNLSYNFNEAMTSYSAYASEHIVNTIDFSRFKTIVDIGGGLGYLLSCILEKCSTIKKGICFDIPNVIQQVEVENEFEKRKISKDRYQFVAGDMFDSNTIPQADAYILKSIIHDWNDNDSIKILNSIRIAAHGKQITIFIADLILLPESEQNKFVSRATRAFDIHMMVLFHAKERTPKQYEYLFEQSGFTLKHLHYTETPYSVIEAVAN